MSALVRLYCNCSEDGCAEEIGIPAQSTSDARSAAKSFGWDCDVIGGETVDWAPGHTLETS